MLACHPIKLSYFSVSYSYMYVRKHTRYMYVNFQWPNHTKQIVVNDGDWSHRDSVSKECATMVMVQYMYVTSTSARIPRVNSSFSTESRKRDLHHAPCASAGISLLFESLGGLSSLSSQTISAIGLHLGQRIGVSPADTRRQLYQKCSISLWRGNAVSWLHRFNTISPRVDGIT